MSETQEEGLSALLHETRTFPPPEELAKEANAQPGIYAEAEADPLAFWASQAKRLTWDTPVDARCSSGTCPSPSGSSAASSTWRSTASTATLPPASATGSPSTGRASPGDTRTITYADLLAMVCQAANALTELGVRAGDKVAIYMPMIPETVVAMLACARLGRAPHGGLRRLLRPTPCAAGSSTATPTSSSPPTAATAAARRAP